MSDITMDGPMAGVAEAGGQPLDTRLLTGVAWALAAFTLGLAVVLLITAEDPMGPVEAMIDWLAR